MEWADGMLYPVLHRLEKDLRDHFYRSSAIELLFSPQVKLYSLPGESERERETSVTNRQRMDGEQERTGGFRDADPKRMKSLRVREVLFSRQAEPEILFPLVSQEPPAFQAMFFSVAPARGEAAKARFREPGSRESAQSGMPGTT